MITLSIVGLILALGIIFFITGINNGNKVIKYLGLFIIVLVVVLVIILYGYLFYSENKTSNSTEDKILIENDMLSIPDRIIYKDGNSNYYIITTKDKIFTSVFNQISKRVDMISTNETILKDEINKIKENEMFIELDYYTKSKNKIFPLEEDYIGMINMQESDGTIVKKGIIDKKELIEFMDNAKKNVMPYKYEKGQNYISKNTFYSEPSTQIFNKKQDGIYQVIIDNKEKLEEVSNLLNFDLEISFSDINFFNNNVIVTVSNYNIEKIEENIGNLKYYFTNYSGEYKSSIYIVSKVVNANCIYCNVGENSEYSNNTQYSYNEQYEINSKKSSNNIVTQSGIVKSVNGNKIEIEFGEGKTICTVSINEHTNITNNLKFEVSNEINIKKGNCIYVEGSGELDNIEATKVSICDRAKVKEEIERYIKNTYRIDGLGIEYYNVDSSGNGYIILEARYENFTYPIKLNVNSNTETYLGMGMHLEKNYGYVLHEMSDITLENKIEDIDNIKGYVKMIEYIAD